ncbi:MAG: hypothetical protein M3O34_04125 [Chloroflexota bacterium]|nr:hypothetical protein [Chloroflexota bacterium]
MRRTAILAAFLVMGLTAAFVPPGRPTQAQANCFPQTGFCITNPAFAQYFNNTGQVDIFGYPVSRSFTLEGFEVQIFQRVVLQMNQGNVARLNVLDPNIMPMTRANASIFPAPDQELAAAAPQPGAPNYAQQVVEFVRSVAPNTFNGQPVNFFTEFNTTVPSGPGDNPDIVTLRNLEIWGVPTSRPAPDPNNGGFIYQRFQRGIMHFRAEVPVTEGILVGQYFRDVIAGRNLPPDLAQDMQGSRFLGQYAPGAPNWLARPAELPNTDLTAAFEPGTGAVTPPPGPPPTQAPAGPTATPTVTPTTTAGVPTVTLQIDDDRIDPGQDVQVTIIARDDNGVDWIQFEGVDEDNGNDNAADDPALARQELDCDDRTECAQVFTISPTVAGDYVLRARARDTEGNRSEWTTTSLRVREGDAPTATPTATTVPPTATPTP